MTFVVLKLQRMCV